MREGQPLLRGFSLVRELLLRGTESVLQGLRIYQRQQWVLRSWQDVFVDLVQGQMQNLFLSLLSGNPLPPPPPYSQLLVAFVRISAFFVGFQGSPNAYFLSKRVCSMSGVKKLVVFQLVPDLRQCAFWCRVQPDGGRCGRRAGGGCCCSPAGSPPVTLAHTRVWLGLRVTLNPYIVAFWCINRSFPLLSTPFIFRGPAIVGAGSPVG